MTKRGALAAFSVIALASLLPLIITIGPFAGFLILAALNACTTTTVETQTNQSGLDLKITNIECDTLAKDASMNIFVSTTGSNEYALLFKYDPISMPVIGYALPSIAIGQSHFDIDRSDRCNLFAAPPMEALSHRL